MNYTIANLEKDYELELDEIGVRIKELGVRSVLLQLPDGLKPYGVAVCDYLIEKTGVEVGIFLGDCFGACDLPDSDADLVVQFGHAVW